MPCLFRTVKRPHGERNPGIAIAVHQEPPVVERSYRQQRRRPTQVHDIDIVNRHAQRRRAVHEPTESLLEGGAYRVNGQNRQIHIAICVVVAARAATKQPRRCHVRCLPQPAL